MAHAVPGLAHAEHSDSCARAVCRGCAKRCPQEGAPQVSRDKDHRNTSNDRLRRALIKIVEKRAGSSVPQVRIMCDELLAALMLEAGDPDVARAAQDMGRRGGLVGGRERAKKLTSDERTASARLAANARWARHRADKSEEREIDEMRAELGEDPP